MDKSEERSIAKKYLHGNFQSGHRTPNEHYLSRVGLRGRKIWFCLALFVSLYLLALTHLVLTCVIVGVLRFNFEGSPYLEFQDVNSLTWLRGASLSDVRLASPSSILTHTNQSLTIAGETDDKVSFGVSSTARFSLDSSSVNVTSASVRVYTTELYGDVSSQQQLQLSATESAVEMNNLLRANSVRATRLSTNTVSNVSEVHASGQLLMRGAMGVTIQGSQVDITAQGDVSISSEMAITMATERVVLSGLPSSSALVRGAQYHLCYCDNGQLFLVENNPQRCGLPEPTSICA